MYDERPDTNEVKEGTGTPRWLGIAVVALAAVSLIALGVGWSAANHARDAQQASINDAKALRTNLDTVSQRLSQSEASNTQLQADLGTVTDKLKVTQTDLDKTRHQSSATRAEYTKQMAAIQDQVQTTQNTLATKANSDDLNAVSTNVNGVRTDLDATRSDLVNARGELGTQIARNHDEIEQLRRLGQRDYYEFTISSRGEKQKLGAVTLELRGVNVKHNQYTVNLYVDDKKFEKKNRAVNEPVFFITHGSRDKLELVINEVSKDKIVGYLSVPKSSATATAASASTGGN
jgi:DNA repair exonuclease SbcCD ATPase subunit